MSGLSAEATDQATSKAIHDLGTNFMLHKETMARAADHGYDNPFTFYFAGRGGVLGDVDGDVVHAAFGWFPPSVVHPMWEAGVAVHGARPAAVRYFVACADWGRDHLGGLEGLDRFTELAGRVVAAAETSGRPLFAGWRQEPGAADGPGRAMQLVHVLREWRGANHLVATTAAGLAPIEAVLTDPAGSPQLLGWNEPYPEITEDHRRRRRDAEGLTDRLCAPAFGALSAGERREFADLVGAMSAAGSVRAP